MGHVVDELRLHGVELALHREGADGDKEHDDDDGDKDETGVGQQVGVTLEEELCRRKAEEDVVLVGTGIVLRGEDIAIGRVLEVALLSGSGGEE